MDQRINRYLHFWINQLCNAPKNDLRKKRKKANKKYEYPDNNKISRYNRTYLDYLAYKKTHINEMTAQMDFLGSIVTDRKSILVLIIPEIHFPFLFIIENKDSNKVVTTFDDIERRIGYEKFILSTLKYASL